MIGLASSYPEARKRFLAAVGASDGRLTSFVNLNLGLTGEELAIDVVELGPADATHAVLLVSGTHGVEGFCGSALQSQLLEELTASGGWSNPSRLVVVHALNPMGFSWVRRVNENNVDLNRNFIDWSAPRPENPGYDTIATLLVPDRWDSAEQERTTALLLEHAMSIGLEQMQADVSGGQFTHPTGLFYGGSGPTWSHQMLLNLLDDSISGTERLTVIDLHSGLGEWGVGEVITSYQPTEPGFHRATDRWGSATSMYDGSSTSAQLVGDWLDALDGLLVGTEVTACSLEFGTVDTVTVLQALRADAWLHAHGDPTAEAAAVTRAEVRAAFADDNPAWLEAVTARFTEVFTQALA